MFENIIRKQLNADGQENAAAENADASTATITAPAEESTPVQTIPVQTAHDDFDWSMDKRHITTYTKEEKEKYHSVYDNTFVQLDDGQMMKGTVVGLTKTDVVLNIGFKSDGLISLNEFRDLPNLSVGDEVEAALGSNGESATRKIVLDNIWLWNLGCLKDKYTRIADTEPAWYYDCVASQKRCMAQYLRSLPSLKARLSSRRKWAARLRSAAIAVGQSSWCSSCSEPKASASSACDRRVGRKGD